MANKRLVNVKTRTETGLEYVISNINLNTPFGKKQMKEIQPFFPGDEEQLCEMLDEIDDILLLVKEDEKIVNLLLEVFMDMKDATFTIQRSKGNALSVVEIFEVKSLLLKMLKIEELLQESHVPIPQKFLLENILVLLNTLDPGKDRLDTFYIYDIFSEKLGEYRAEKRKYEAQIRKLLKVVKEEVKQKYGIILTPNFDITVSKSNRDQIRIIREIQELEQEDEDYISVIFRLKKTEDIYEITRYMEQINIYIEEEELKIREGLSQVISRYEEELLTNCMRIGKLDITLSKALYAKAHNCVKPQIVAEHVIDIEDGRHLQVEDILISKQKVYCPVSILLKDGVTCITGANMGGKTVSLKLAGLVPLLAQYGFFVPAKRAKVGLSNYIQILIGDSQSMERGLSSFGSEMEELKEIIDNSKDRSIILIDEIASGTNPIEGLALTKSVVDYLKDKPYISLITTHFDSVTMAGSVRNMQVVGLANADFGLLNREIRYSNRRERINIIAKYMDYRLCEIASGGEVPKDALNIARMLGISDEIIDRAKQYIE